MGGVRRFLPSLVPAFGWGAMFPIADSAIVHVDPFHLTAIRYLLAATGFLALLWVFEGLRALRTDGRGLELFLFGTAGIAGFNLLAFAGLEHTTPEHAALIVATSPLMALLADAALARRAPRAGHALLRPARAGRRADGDRPRRPAGPAQRRRQRRRPAGAGGNGGVRRLHVRRPPLLRLLVAPLHGPDRDGRDDHRRPRHPGRGPARARWARRRPATTPTSGGRSSTSS